jgi:nucleotide-binding universal stress UspA family protein
MFKKILVPLDGSPLSEQALSPALALAKEVNGEVILLSIPFLKHAFVAEPAGYGVLLPYDSLEDTRQELEEYLVVVQKIHAHPDVTMRTMILDGDEAGVIVDTAVSEQADLIVMSTHGYSGLTRWVLGSVTERVLRAAPCPVLVMRNERPLTRMMITLDGSFLAEDALEPGFEVARRLSSEVVLLRVGQGSLTMDTADAKYLEEVEKGLGQRLLDRVYQQPEEYLREITQLYPLTGLTVRTIVVDGPVADTILEYAEAQGIDLIVMATHGRTGLRRWVYGSVMEKVLHGANCSVMVIRPPADTLK